ncbi:hypothetical protein LCGC14_0427720 [marine sediment metagenome]|uniref:Uncharacterized protein n=1 Tax=marine sediment metagenome TaxID=412755 RepID=A0A0F9T777_9ZZZZ
MKKPSEEIKLGRFVRDSVTGFEGTATARVFTIAGLTRYQVEAPAVDGKVGLTEWFSEERLIVKGVSGLPGEEG